MDPNLPGVADVSEELTTELARSLAGRPKTYTPRTRHLGPDGSPKYTNRLIRESSPYLLQHAHNAVNWYPWGQEAFARAKQTNRLMFLSVGYSTCHWCHVMEHESFEDEEIAAFLNAHFVPVKVDREERPDIDAIYMTSVQMMSGHGGWPMSVVMTAEGKPIFGGTYFPPRDGDRGARTGFLTLLRELERAQRESRDELIAQAEQVTDRLREMTVSEPNVDLPSAFAIRDTVVNHALRFDPQWGGWGKAPKFPRSAVLELIARYARRTSDDAALTMVELTLEKMAWGGLHDHVGGGFHRYSVDAFWRVPHFEKMLYDNAQLAVSYAMGWQLTGRDDFADVARSICEYVLREMTHTEGGFYSATDADSLTPSGTSDEGYFFSWSAEEIRQVLDGEQRRVVEFLYDISESGNFEGRNVLNRSLDDRHAADHLDLSVESFQEILVEAHCALYQARSKRPAPLRDENIIVSWNALMISGFAAVGRTLDEPRFIEAASDALKFLFANLFRDGRLQRHWSEGKAATPGFLDDYAFLVQACLDTLEATSDGEWLSRALGLQQVLDEDFWDDDSGAYWFSGEQNESLILREKTVQDGAEPSGNSVAAHNLLRLYAITDNETYRRQAEQIFSAFGQTVDYAGPAVPLLLSALDRYLDTPMQIAVAEGPEAKPLGLVLRRSYLPNATILSAETEGVPWTQNKSDLRSAVFVCREGRCSLPTHSPEQLRELLEPVRPLFAERVPKLRLKGGER